MDPVAEARRMARPLRGSQDLDEVLARTSSARYVLIGEASHGTSEFYAWRAELTKRHEAVPDEDSLFVFADSSWASQVRGHRAIGVVYQPRTERAGNYVPTILDRRYDTFVHCDHTDALNPLHQFEHAQGELETYPSAE